MSYLEILKKANLEPRDPETGPHPQGEGYELNEISRLAVETESPGIPTRRCFACHGWLFWRSIHGAVICAACHAPASRDLVSEWAWIEEGSKRIQ
jgi:hypothetical protein